MLAFWANPFAAAMLQKCAAHREELRKTRLLAEDAEGHLDQALKAGADAATLNSLLFISRLLDYSGQRFQTAPEMEDMWHNLGRNVPKTTCGGMNGILKSPIRITRAWWTSWTLSPNFEIATARNG